ncbi:MAG: hypothetical protein MJ252_24150, partial [archaeon]|nr:hypothetical protein [archaeon]
MENYFKCNFCREIISDVYESECCGKLYCSHCIGSLINSKCTLCGKMLRFSKNHFAERLLHSIKVNCKYGCGKILTYNQMKIHLLSCEKKNYECSFPNCNFKGKKKETLIHLTSCHSSHLLILMENHDFFKNSILKITKDENTQEKENETLVIPESSFNDFPRSLLENEVGDRYNHFHGHRSASFDSANGLRPDLGRNVNYNSNSRRRNNINDNRFNMEFNNFNDFDNNYHHRLFRNRIDDGIYMNRNNNEYNISNSTSLLLFNENDVNRNDSDINIEIIGNRNRNENINSHGSLFSSDINTGLRNNSNRHTSNRNDNNIDSIT